MDILSIDVETYSDQDLNDGVYRYVDSPSFEILLFGYAFNDEEVQVIDLACGEELPERVRKALVDPTVEKHAFNASFERVCIQKFFGIPLPIEQWWCTQAHAAILGLPASLKDVAKTLELAEQKDSAGTLLINYFSKPCKPTRANGGRTRNLPAHDMDKWKLFCRYNRQDVITERAISEYLKTHYPGDITSEKLHYHINEAVNDYGIGIDMDLVNAVISFNTDYQVKLLNRAKEITKLDNPNSRSQLKDWLEKQGVAVESLTKETIPGILETSADPAVREVLKIHLALSMTSVTKYQRMQEAICADGRIHGTLKYYGAARSGRYAGRIIQTQNFPQNHMAELDAVRTLVKQREWEYLTDAYPDIQDVFKQLLRTALVPAKGMKYCVADYHSIEAKIIAWLAHETWAEEVFRTDGKIYERTASQMFHVPLDQVDKDLRQRGKIATLACGYGGGAMAMKAMDIRHAIPESEYPQLVARWRKANPHIVALWSKMDQAARKAVTQGKDIQLDQLIFRYLDHNLFICLPSGRWLSYFHFDVESDRQFTYWGTDISGWAQLHTWGGKLTENVVQAIARDELASAIDRVWAAGYKISFHIHDEIIAEAPADEADSDMDAFLRTLGYMQYLMTCSNGWDEGLHLTTAGYTTDYYRKD